MQRRTATHRLRRQGRRAVRRARGHRPDLPVRVQPRPVGHRHDHHRRDQLVRPRLRPRRRQHRQRRARRRPRPAAAGSAPPRTPSCSGPSAAAAVTSGSSPGSRSRCTPPPRCTAAGFMWPIEQMRRGPAHLQARPPRPRRSELTTWFHILPVPAAARAARADPRQVVRLGRRRLHRRPPRRPSRTWRRTAPSRAWRWTSSATCR